MRNYETNVYEYVEKETGAHVVKAATMYAGSPVSATAKCSPEDAYDFDFGRDLALLRLDYKIAKKREASMKHAVNMCDQNLAFIKAEEKRIKQSKERAEIAITDRKIEQRSIKALIDDLMETVN